ncbi:glycosyltransferase family 4 protein [Pseudomonas sp. GD03855]|nr:glycosyltransferase family 4 protein [Pseudomonas sp. GD03856]MDH2264889.1 glycosyltransferase family 4 protein [Pseudomonas sp. GD03855]
MNVILSVEPVRFPLTGIGRYTYELASRLQQAPSVSVRYFSNIRFLESLPTAADQSDSAYGLKRLVQKSTVALEAYRLLMPLLRRQALKGNGDALYHGPNFFLPPYAGPSIATFHDLSPFTWMECHAPQRVRYWQKEMRKTLDRASALITDSEYTRHELAGYFGWPIERIHAVPLASSAEFCVRHYEDLRLPLARYGLAPGNYSLFVGTIEPRKNIDTLLAAYGRLPVAIRSRWPLILTGYEGWRNEQIRQRIEQAEAEGWARYLGFVPASDLPLLFSGARLFTFPSLYEGFGLPVLEAMSSGVPVVCSNSSSLPEVAGKAALMSEPLDVEALTDNLRRGLEDEHWRSSAIDKGLSHSAMFSWQRCASETIAVYKTVAGC